MMNEGVKILLERIKTNPDEFVREGVYSKWSDLFSMYQDALDPEDVETFKNARNKLIQEHFTQRVMKELLAPEEDDSLGKWFTKPQSVTLSAGQTQGQYTVANTTAVTGTITINQHQEQVKHMEAHLKALQKQKKHQTLFGKLFNYS